jgi:hypothetical protein
VDAGVAKPDACHTPIVTKIPLALYDPNSYVTVSISILNTLYGTTVQLSF